MKNVTLEVTKLESEVLTALANEMYAEYNFSDIGPTELEKLTEIEMKRLRGVLGSLVNKGLIDIDHREDEGYKNRVDMWVTYLHGDAVGLVSHWVEDEVVHCKAELVIKETK